MKVIVRKGFEAMAGAMEKVMIGVGERMVEEKGRRDRVDRVLEERMQWLEERNLSEGKARGREDRGREERMRILEQRLEDQEKERQVREATIYEALTNLKERTGGGEDRRGGEWEDMAERIQALELIVKGKEGDSKGSEEQVSERMRKIEERDKADEEERKEKDRIIEEKMRLLEEGLEGERKEREKMEKERMEKERRIEKGLEKERSERMKWEEERREEREKSERIESIKEMELKVNDSMENLKILNLKFEKVSQEKAELLKEAEGMIKEKVLDRDRKECECILRRSRVYILGKGTEEKELGKEKICTAPLLVKCGSQVERERLEGMLRRVGVRAAFHWPREMLEFVDKVRGWVEGMGYRKEEYFIKVRPYKVEGVLQLRAEVKRKDGKGEGFKRVGSWSCPPLAKNLW
jgi:hypothetical protein